MKFKGVNLPAKIDLKLDEVSLASNLYSCLFL